MSESETPTSCPFGLLFERDVMEIWEKIFLSLDHSSFKHCLGVCKAWNQLLTSAPLQKKSKAVFAADMWMDIDNLASQLCKTEKNVIRWAATGDEVAYIEEVRMPYGTGMVTRWL